MHYHASTQLPLTIYVVLIKDVRVLVQVYHHAGTRVLEYQSMVKSAPQVKKARPVAVACLGPAIVTTVYARASLLQVEATKAIRVILGLSWGIAKPDVLGIPVRTRVREGFCKRQHKSAFATDCDYR